MKKVGYALFFDNHTAKACPDVGHRFDAELFADQIEDIGADLVGFHAKCNQGFCYYDTKIGNRHPSLRLTHNACFADPKHTVLSMTTSTGAMQSDLPNPEPELVLDEGVCHVFAEVWINGRRLASGTWGGSESSAQHKDSVHFSGRGVIHVRGGGIVICFR